MVSLIVFVLSVLEVPYRSLYKVPSTFTAIPKIKVASIREFHVHAHSSTPLHKHSYLSKALGLFFQLIGMRLQLLCCLLSRTSCTLQLFLAQVGNV